MKTYLKRSSEKFSTTISSYSNLAASVLSHSNTKQRIIQPSTKEQQRLLQSSSNPTRFQHVHWGKYGIKPIWPSDKTPDEQTAKPSIKESWLSFFTKTEKSSSSNLKSDSKYNFFSSWIDQTDRSTLNFVCASLISILLLLLLLVYVFNRRQEKNRPETRQKQKTIRNSRENDFRDHLTINEDRPSTLRTLPTIVEENSPVSSPSSAKFENPTNIFNDPAQNETKSSDPKENLPKENNVNSKAIRKRRSRFDEPETTKETNSAAAVINEEPLKSHLQVIGDEFTSLDQINQAVKDVGLVHSQLIFGIDYTISNLETGKNSFNGLSLHHIQDDLLNPYQSVITIIGRTLERFDSDTLIPAFGFGDRATLDRKIFPLRPDGTFCKGFIGVLEAYNEITPKVRMSGPTNFAPLIREAIRIVKKTRQYHILVIVADGQVTNERQTKDAIVEASNYPLSIVMVGVGDGPWDMMKEFDDSLPTRQFDNFQFVNYNSIVQAANNQDSAFALHALMEIPSQYTAIKKLGLLQED